MTDSGYRCPTNPDHGRLVLLDTKDDRAYYCPHFEHSKSLSNAVFTFNEVDLTYKLSIIKQAKAAHIIKKRASKHRR